MNIESAYVVTVAFSEGHAEVIGIDVRNHKDRAWDLKTEINGTFKVRSLFDDSLETTKKTKATRALSLGASGPTSRVLNSAHDTA